MDEPYTGGRRVQIFKRVMLFKDKSICKQIINKVKKALVDETFKCTEYLLLFIYVFSY